MVSCDISVNNVLAVVNSRCLALAGALLQWLLRKVLKRAPGCFSYIFLNEILQIAKGHEEI